MAMTDDDENELHRLCEMLREVHNSLDADSGLREAVTKAGFGLSLAFIHGHRLKIENLALSLGRPLSDEQRRQLQSLGINPETP
jgi:hypothetical protein